MGDRGKDNPTSTEHFDEKTYLRDIVASSLYPDIAEYTQILEDDAKKVDALGPMSISELETAKLDLVNLRSALAAWIKSPSSFTPVERRESGDFSKQKTMTVKLRFPGDPVELPFDKENAQFQINFYLDLRKRLGETKSGAIRHESLKGHSPQQVLQDIEFYRPYDASLIISTHHAWVHPRSERVHIEPGAGIELAYRTLESVSSRGIAYVGNTPHFSEVIAANSMGVDQFLYLESMIVKVYRLSSVPRF